MTTATYTEITGAMQHYVIRGGLAGGERLRLMSRVLQRTTGALLDRVALADGMHCLDVGCGAGDVTVEIARRIAPRGIVIGIDLDAVKLGLAREHAMQSDVASVASFMIGDIRRDLPSGPFDLIYARFVLSHLNHPEKLIDTFHRHLRPGGRLVLEDADFSSYFAYPECAAFDAHRELLTSAMRRRGGDPEIGRRLPLMLNDAGFDAVGVEVVQPMGLEGEVKLLAPLTTENMIDSLVREGLESQMTIDRIVTDLYAFARDPRTLMGVPRIVQAWGARPAR